MISSEDGEIDDELMFEGFEKIQGLRNLMSLRVSSLNAQSNQLGLFGAY